MSKHSTDPPKVAMKLPSELWHWLEQLRIHSRKDCRNGPRPCPHVSCEHHLLFSTQPGQPTRWEVKPIEIQQMEFTCALDLAEHPSGSPLDQGLESKPLPPSRTPCQVTVSVQPSLSEPTPVPTE